jgi:hypothetical protein
MMEEFSERRSLQTSIRENWEGALQERITREKLIEVYESRSEWWRSIINDLDGGEDDRPLVNNFMQFVRGHILSLAFSVPRWSVQARTPQAKGFDKRIQALLNRLMELLGFRNLMRSWALDSAFGRAIAKTIEGIAPKGVDSAVWPRTYRVPPPLFIFDRSAQSIFESTFYADIYLVPLREAKMYPGYNAEVRAGLSEWTESSDYTIPKGTDDRHFVESMTRLIDIYIPKEDMVYTWPCNNDTFADVGAMRPLAKTPSVINPYSILQLTLVPDKPDDYAMLETLLPLHLASNSLLKKALDQAKFSKRNPLAPREAEQDMDDVLSTPDNEGVLVEFPEKMGLYTLPGPDPSIVSFGSMLLGLFGQFGGNLEVALGNSAGADTARQTQALMGQIQALQTVARTEFDVFLSDIGKKLATLAFKSESLKLNIGMPVPGTKVVANVGWAPSAGLTRIGRVCDYDFEVVPLSTSFRTPQEYLAQLDAASNIIQKFMMMKVNGMPINLGAVIASCAEAFDLIVNLPEWWSGEEVEPTPQETASNVYQSMADNSPSRREISYQGQGGGGGGAQPAPPPTGGFQGFTRAQR